MTFASTSQFLVEGSQCVKSGGKWEAANKHIRDPERKLLAFLLSLVCSVFSFLQLSVTRPKMASRRVD